MNLKDKYSKLIDYAGSALVDNLSITEKDGILYVSGTATEDVKEKIWDIYNQIDPDMRSGDMVLDISVEEGERYYQVKNGDSLSKIAQHYPGMTWQRIYDANKDIIKDPNIIYPGQKIKIPQ